MKDIMLPLWIIIIIIITIIIIIFFILFYYYYYYYYYYYNAKVSNRAKATSQQAVKLFQSIIAEACETAERVHCLRCTEEWFQKREGVVCK